VTLTVVQSATSTTEGAAASFPAGVTAGNTIVMGTPCISDSNATITTSLPTLGGTAFPGAVQAVQTTGSFEAYAAVWILPDIPSGLAGQTALSFTSNEIPLSTIAFEVAGLGPAPSVDKVVALTGGSSGTGVVTIGPTAATTGAPEFVMSASACTFGTFTVTDGPWTVLQGESAASFAGWQIATSSGGTFTWNATAPDFFDWAGVIVTIAGSSSPATHNGALSMSATAGLSARGVKTAKGALSASATSALSSHGTKTAEGVLRAQATARLTAAGAKTALGALNASATARLTAAGTGAVQGALRAAATAFLSSAAVKTARGAFTATAQALIAFAGSGGSGPRAPQALALNPEVLTIDAAISVADPYDAVVNVSNDDFGIGVAVVEPYDLTSVEWTMQQVNITLAEFNDQTVTLAITSSGAPLNLTGFEVDMFLKPQAGVPDTTEGVLKLSTVTGEITVTNAEGGLANVAIPAADLSQESLDFYRVDVVSSAGLRNTAGFGDISYISL
jgi:hypothetical protein